MVGPTLLAEWRRYRKTDSVWKHGTDKHLMEIVGVVGDVRDVNLEYPIEPTLYGYSLQRPQWWQFRVWRSSFVLRGAVRRRLDSFVALDGSKPQV